MSLLMSLLLRTLSVGPDAGVILADVIVPDTRAAAANIIVVVTCVVRLSLPDAGCGGDGDDGFSVGDESGFAATVGAAIARR